MTHDLNLIPMASISQSPNTVKPDRVALLCMEWLRVLQSDLDLVRQWKQQVRQQAGHIPSGRRNADPRSIVFAQRSHAVRQWMHLNNIHPFTPIHKWLKQLSSSLTATDSVLADALDAIEVEWRDYKLTFVACAKRALFEPQSNFDPQFQARFFTRIHTINLFINRAFVQHVGELPRDRWPHLAILSTLTSQAQSSQSITSSVGARRPYASQFTNAREQEAYETMLESFPIDSVHREVQAFVSAAAERCKRFQQQRQRTREYTQLLLHKLHHIGDAFTNFMNLQRRDELQNANAAPLVEAVRGRVFALANAFQVCCLNSDTHIDELLGNVEEAYHECNQIVRANAAADSTSSHPAYFSAFKSQLEQLYSLQWTEQLQHMLQNALQDFMYLHKRVQDGIRPSSAVFVQQRALDLAIENNVVELRTDIASVQETLSVRRPQSHDASQRYQQLKTQLDQQWIEADAQRIHHTFLQCCYDITQTMRQRALHRTTEWDSENTDEKSNKTGQATRSSLSSSSSSSSVSSSSLSSSSSQSYSLRLLRALHDLFSAHSHKLRTGVLQIHDCKYLSSRLDTEDQCRRELFTNLSGSFQAPVKDLAQQYLQSIQQLQQAVSEARLVPLDDHTELMDEERELHDKNALKWSKWAAYDTWPLPVETRKFAHSREMKRCVHQLLNALTEQKDTDLSNDSTSTSDSRHSYAVEKRCTVGILHNAYIDKQDTLTFKDMGQWINSLMYGCLWQAL